MLVLYCGGSFVFLPIVASGRVASSEHSGSLALALTRRRSASRSKDAEKTADQDARFSALYETTFSRVYALLRSQVRSSEVAEDLISKVFSKAYEHWRHAPQGETATFWLFRIARNTLIDHWRVEGRRESLRVTLDDVELSDPSTPESVYAAREQTQALLEAISTLEDDDRMLLSLKFAGQRSNRDIASILGISEAAVSMRLLRALRRLRARLQEEGRL